MFQLINLSFKNLLSGGLVMKHIRNFLLCLVLLAVAGILHHQWLQMSGNTGIVSQASAATLQASSGAGDSCTGTGSWHFVNPQSGGICSPLTVTFSCGTVTQTQENCLSHNNNYANVTTTGSCTLLDASNGAEGKIVLSGFACVPATPTPTPTPTPTATPTPTPF